MNNFINNQNFKKLDNENKFNWLAVLKDLKQYLGNEIYESWIKNIKLKREFDNYLVLSAPTRFMRDWIVSRYADKILDNIKKFKPSTERLEFIIDSQEAAVKKNVSFSTKYSEEITKVSSIDDSILNYNRLDPNKNFDNFIVGESNNLAFDAAKKICQNNSHYNPLYIYGGVGMGKTHLLNSIGLTMQEKFNVMFISAERFMYHFIKSIRSKEMVKFKDFFRKSDIFIIDDIQFVSGKEAMQEEFFHTFNDLMTKGSQVVISADRAPNNLVKLQERIKSRLSGGLVVDIQATDLNLRIKIIRKKLDELQNSFAETIIFSDEVVNFLASEMRVNVREMIGALNRVFAYSRINKKMPTVYDCKCILKDITDSQNRIVTIEKIQKLVSSYYKVSMNEMLSSRRSRSLVRPRQIAMYLSKKYTVKSLPDIGKSFLGRDHTTVIHAIKVVEKLMKIDKKFGQELDNVKQILSESVS